MRLLHELPPRASSLPGLFIFGLPALISLALLGARLTSVVDLPGSLLTTTGGESVSIYNILKFERGLTLYEDPRESPYYSTTLYNAGFYFTYALAVHVFGSDTAHDVVVIRLTTLALVGFGLAGLIAYAVFDLRGRSRDSSGWGSSVAMSSAGVVTMLGTVTGWWVLSARPDMGAAAFCLLALSLIFTIGPRHELLCGLLGGICLAASWSFKQSCVLVFVGLAIAALMQKRYRFLAALSFPVVSNHCRGGHNTWSELPIQRVLRHVAIGIQRSQLV